MAAANAGDDFLVLTKAPPGRAQKILALGVAPGFLIVTFAVLRPFAGVQLPAIEAFVPFYVTGICVNALITAVLLFAQFSILRTRGLLVIANGYVFSALIIIPYALTFPGLFVPGQILVGGLQSTPWIYILRHCGFAMFLSAFALIEGFSLDARIRQDGIGRAVALSIAITACVVLAMALVCIEADRLLPALITDRLRFGAAWTSYASLPIMSLYAIALILLWFQRHTVLGLWLMVVACVHLAGVALSFDPPSSRFSLGWYAVITTNLLANSVVLVVLLVEISKLYTRVSVAIRAQYREREARLVTGDAVAAMVAHEVKQPLAAMITRAQTSLRRLEGPAPDLDNAKEDIRRIVSDGYRAGMVIDSIRANFKPDARTRAPLDVNGLIEETMALVRDDLHNKQIILKTELGSGLPDVAGDRTQLQQVLLNLVANAVDSMTAEDGAHTLCVTSQMQDDSEIVVSVADTGGGIGAQDIGRIFNPLFTTKSGGMGMGLSICRSIVEAHDGHIWASPNDPKGAVFRFSLSPEMTGERP
jgi:signal transduction histidine kinase